MFYLDNLAKKRRKRELEVESQHFKPEKHGVVTEEKIFKPQESIPMIPSTMTFKEWEAHEYSILKPRLKKIKVKLGKKVADTSCVKVYLSRDLEKLYNRSPLCLKVFKRSKSVWGYPHSCNPSSIISSTIAQNLLWLEGHSPRIYDLVSVRGQTAQVSDYVGGDFKMIQVKDSRLVLDERVWGGKENFVGGKFVDFEGSYLRDYKTYRGSLLREISITNEDNGHCKGMYQSVYNASGIRNTEERLKALGFKDFNGKKVLDIGCSNGMFCRAAIDLGAKRVVGLEWSNMAKLAQTLAFLDGYFNIDFYGVDLRKLTKKKLAEITGIKKFDVHLFLAMENHIGWYSWIKNCQTLYYEGHGQPRKIKVIDKKKGVIREAIYKD